MRFVLFWPISFVATLLAYPLVPVAVLLCDKDGRLPWLFRWLETHDNLGWKGPLTEGATTTVTERFGRKVGLIWWLWRNKCYTLRYWMRARVTEDMERVQCGTLDEPTHGFSYWFGRVGPYWEFQPRFAFGRGQLYMRIGWKMVPYFKTPNKLNLAAGIFQGVTPRSDDWDD